MRSFRFQLVLDRRPAAEQIERIIANGHGDGVFGSVNGVPIVSFQRDGTSLAATLTEATQELDDVGIQAIRVLNDDLLTLADIADRIGQSRESVRRYAAGKRGPGDFPPPVNPNRTGVSFYRWSEVARWVRENVNPDVPDVDPALAFASLLLQARQYRAEVQDAMLLVELLAE